MQADIVRLVNEAKLDMRKADNLIRDYLPFIKSETSKYLKRSISEQDDEVSIAMIGFHEAIRSYDDKKGNFLSYASMIMRNRMIDYYRKESRHRNILSIDQSSGEDDIPLSERLMDSKDHYEESDSMRVTKTEILELTKQLSDFGVSLTDISENSPKQERTLESCRQVVQYAIDNSYILKIVEKTGKLPIKDLVEGTKVPKKTLERHRKYILAMLIIQTNGYEIIRGHLRGVLNMRGGGTIWNI